MRQVYAELRAWDKKYGRSIGFKTGPGKSYERRPDGFLYERSPVRERLVYGVNDPDPNLEWDSNGVSVDRRRETEEEEKLEFDAKYTWKFVDSFALFPTSLAEIGKSLPVLDENGKTRVDDKGNPMFLVKLHEEDRQTREEKRKWYATVNQKVLEAYNRRDCRILWEGIDHYEDVLLKLGGQLGRTGAGSALTLIRRGFLREDILTNELTNRLASNAYIASRVEYYRRELRGGFAHDINSSFAASQLRPCPGQQKDGPVNDPSLKEGA